VLNVKRVPRGGGDPSREGEGSDLVQCRKEKVPFLRFAFKGGGKSKRERRPAHGRKKESRARREKKGKFFVCG